MNSALGDTAMPCIRRRILGLLLCICLLSAWLHSGFSSEADEKQPTGWPVVRGNQQQTGVSAGTLPDKLDILWRFQTRDAIEAAAAIVEDTVYFTSYDEHLYALDLSSGQLRWKYQAGPLKAAPGVYRDAVYIGDEDGVVHCVDRKTGQKRWTFETRGEITATANFAGDRILIGSYDQTLYCLGLDGKKLWSVTTEGPVNGSPAIAGNRTFVAGCDSQLHIIDIKTGKEAGAVDLGGQAAATAAIRGDSLYVGTMTDQVLGIDWQTPKVLWTFEPKKRAQAFFGSAAVTEKLVIVGNRNRKIYALNRQNGEQVWEFETDGRVDPSPVVVGQRVYAPSLDGRLYVLDHDSGKKLAEYPLGRSIAASPAVAQDRLLLGTTDGVLFCLGKKK